MAPHCHSERLRCHSERSEESRFSVIQGEILRHLVPQNDKIALHRHSEQKDDKPAFLVILNAVKTWYFSLTLVPRRGNLRVMQSEILRLPTRDVPGLRLLKDDKMAPHCHSERLRCHSERSEESRFSVIQGEILRHLVPQNDKIALHRHSEQLHRHSKQKDDKPAFLVILNTSLSF